VRLVRHVMGRISGVVHARFKMMMAVPLRLVQHVACIFDIVMLVHGLVGNGHLNQNLKPDSERVDDHLNRPAAAAGGKPVTYAGAASC
jgi:hypothetical protein